VALLRAVNVGGAAPVSMAAVREILTGVGLHDVRSLLQSGNLVFGSASRTPRDLERLLEDALASSLDLRTEFFVRTANEWDQVVSRNPFPKEAQEDPARLNIAFLKEAPSAPAWETLRSAIRGRERFVGDGRQAYVFYPDGMGRSKLTTPLLERSLGTRSTSRNWNTILKLQSAL